MTDSILPHNSSKLERDIEELGGKKRIDKVKNPVGKLWNPQETPPETLPYLAWALSVDTWEDDWSDEIKRNVIAASVEVHRKKGTIGSVRTAIAAIGLDVELEEWFEIGGAPHTFKITAWSNDNINNNGTTRLLPKAHEDVINGVNASKPVRSHFELLFGTRIPTNWGMAADTSAAGRVDERNEVIPYTNRSSSNVGGVFDTEITGRVNERNEVIPYTSKSETEVGAAFGTEVPVRVDERNEVIPYTNKSETEVGGALSSHIAARAKQDIEVIPYTSKIETEGGAEFSSHVTSRVIEENEIVPYPNRSETEAGSALSSHINARAAEDIEIIPYTTSFNAINGGEFEQLVSARMSEDIAIIPFTNTTDSDLGLAGLMTENSRVNLNLEII